MSPRSPATAISRFRPNVPADDPVYHNVPDDGLCLNVFLLVTDRPGSDRVLLGRIDPGAPWESLGAMSRPRIAKMGDRWMLPCRQLFVFESPDHAARAIAEEQLACPSLPLEGPSVLSEAWERPEPAGKGRHWDLSFLYRARWPADRPCRAPAWKELAFCSSRELVPAEVGRGHLDVLALAGLPVQGPAVA